MKALSWSSLLWGPSKKYRLILSFISDLSKLKQSTKYSVKRLLAVRRGDHYISEHNNNEITTSSIKWVPYPCSENLEPLTRDFLSKGNKFRLWCWNNSKTPQKEIPYNLQTALQFFYYAPYIHTPTKFLHTIHLHRHHLHMIPTTTQYQKIPNFIHTHYHTHPLTYRPSPYTHNKNNNKYSVPHISLLSLHQRMYHFISTQHNPYWKLNTTSTIRLVTPLYDSLQHTTNTTPTLRITNKKILLETLTLLRLNTTSTTSLPPKNNQKQRTYQTPTCHKKKFYKTFPLLLYNISIPNTVLPYHIYFILFSPTSNDTTSPY